MIVTRSIPRRSLLGLSDARRLGFGAILTVIVVFSFWSSLAPISGAVVASGVVKAEGNRKAVQHTDGGLIKALLVKDGDTVRTGQPLLELEDIEVDAGYRLVRELILFETLRQARLDTEQQLISVFAAPEVIAGEYEGLDVHAAFGREQRIFAARRANLDEQIASLERELIGIDDERRALQRQIDADRRAVILAKEELSLNDALTQQKVVSRVKVIEVERLLEDYQARLGQHEADYSRAGQRQDQIRLKMAMLKNEYQNRATEEFKESTGKRVELRERMRPLEAGARRKTLLAPASGQIVGLRYHAAGEVVSPREVIMEIVPDQDQLVINAKVHVDAIHDLALGQESDIRFTTFNSRTTPLVKGRVSYISPDALEEKNGVPYYQVLVRPDGASLRRAGIEALQPGMAAEVFMLTEARSTLDYLIAPVMDTVRHALRER